MSQFYSIITNKGLELINHDLSIGKKLNLEHIAVGDSNGSYYEPDANQTELVNEKYRAKISEVTELVAKAQIPNDVGGFYIREVGIFDDENNLILIAKQPETYKPIIEEGSSKELWIKVLIQAINHEVLELKIDTSIQTATIELVANLINLHTHKDLMPIRIYDTNFNGLVDTCEYVDGGLFVGDAESPELENNPINLDLANQNAAVIIPENIMNTDKYDKNNNGIVDNAENIDAGEF